MPLNTELALAQETLEHRANLVDLVNQGHTLGSMSHLFHVDQTTVHRWLRQAGLGDFYKQTRSLLQMENAFDAWRRYCIRTPRLEMLIEIFRQAYLGGFNVKIRCKPSWSFIEGARVRMSMHSGAWKVDTSKGRTYRYVSVAVRRPTWFNVIHCADGRWLFLLPAVANKTDWFRLRPFEVYQAAFWPTPTELREAVERCERELSR